MLNVVQNVLSYQYTWSTCCSFDTIKTKIECLSIFLVNCAMEGWFVNLGKKKIEAPCPWEIIWISSDPQSHTQHNNSTSIAKKKILKYQLWSCEKCENLKSYQKYFHLLAQTSLLNLRWLKVSQGACFKFCISLSTHSISNSEIFLKAFISLC